MKDAVCQRRGRKKKVMDENNETYKKVRFRKQELRNKLKNDNSSLSINQRLKIATAVVIVIKINFLKLEVKDISTFAALSFNPLRLLYIFT